MAVSLSSLKQKGQREATARKLAKEYEAQQRRESKRKGWSSLLGGVGGKILGTALAGMTGGLAAPLLMAAGTFGGKIAAHELTKGMRAKTGGLKGDKYGYGGAEAKTLREGLESQMRASDPMKQRGGFGRDLMSAYGSAAIAGDLGGAKGLLKGETGLKEALVGKDGWKGFSGSKEALFGLIPGESMVSEGIDPTMEYQSLAGSGMTGSEYDALVASRQAGAVAQDDDTWDLGSEWKGVPFLQQGGQVPNQEELLMLLSLAEAQNQKAPLEEVKQPTISEYFGTQNKTLGGSNTKSLSQMLGR